ncbi:MAG: TIGR01440 family protein [Blautia sp.]|nr:TIGR01440 family protein [Blautia sp.]
MFEEIRQQAAAAVEEICSAAKLQRGQILVVGCSTSEVCGDKIGTNSNVEVAQVLVNAIYKTLKEKGIFLAAQCCEHLNRAIVVEAAAVPFQEIVNVIPQPKAGGSFATFTYKELENPVVVEEIKADAGIDIGETLIGMHLKKVAVPVRLVNNRIGCAHLTAARSRGKFIGGERAVYDHDKM